MKKTRISNLKYAAAPLALGLALISTPSFAQDAAADEEAAEAIVVTGSRIARPDLQATSPITSVTAEQFDLTGTVTVETLLNDLPQFVPGNTRVSNNQGGEDFSTLDLRGLGAGRTLILVDGERVPASSTSGVVDIGTIPAGLIERVDVVTGGASAVYGSDAMAGVVNFVLKDRFEGVELSAQTGFAEGGIGSSYNVQALIGANFAEDRGNVTLFVSHYDRSSVSQNDLDITRPASTLLYNLNTERTEVGSHPDDFIAGVHFNPAQYAPGGSSTPPWGRVVASASNPWSATFASVDSDCNSATPSVAVTTTGNLSFSDSGALMPYLQNNRCSFADRATGSSRYNFNPDNFLITPYQRSTLAATMNYALTDDVKMKVLANYVDSSQVVNLAPTPAASPSIIVPYNSPLIPASLAAVLATRPNPTADFAFDRRFSETGPRIGTYGSQTFTIRSTWSGPIADNWDWDSTVSYGKTTAINTLQNNINKTAVAHGLRGCPTGSSLPGCVPINIFGANTLTPAMVNFIAADTKEIREFEQFRVAGNITGDIIELPAGPVAVAVGAEYRKDIGRIIVDDLQRSGNIYGFNATQDQNGSIDVREVYGEVRIPVLADKPFMQELSIEAGGRYSDYSTIGKLSNWKAGANYAPFTWLKFRGIFNKAARAPSVVELFQNGDQGFPSLTDPCNATPARTAATRTICLQQGVPTSGIDSFAAANSQVQAFSFGDANLQEEKAETYTLGAVITPNLPIGRGSLTVDYFNIKIDNVISALGSSYYIRGCYVSGRADDCAKVIRNRSTGQIESVNTGIANQDALKTSGIDVGLNWSFDLSEIAGSLPGSLSFNEQFSWLDSYSINGTEYASTSSGGIGSAFPEFKSTLSVAYRLSDFTAQLRWNYSASVEEDWDETPNPQTPALSTFDLSLRQVVAKSFEVTAIVQNLFEQKPVRTPNGYFDQGGVDTAWYNNIILGRTFTISGKVRF